MVAMVFLGVSMVLLGGYFGAAMVVASVMYLGVAMVLLGWLLRHLLLWLQCGC